MLRPRPHSFNQVICVRFARDLNDIWWRRLIIAFLRFVFITLYPAVLVPQSLTLDST